MKKEYCWLPTPEQIGDLALMLWHQKYKYKDMESSQFSMEGFPPKEEEDVEHYIAFLEVFRDKHLDALVDLYLGYGERTEGAVFLERLGRALSDSASHSKRSKKGWKRREFLTSQIMLDLNEVFYDSFDSTFGWVKFGSGASAGQKMFYYTEEELKAAKVGRTKTEKKNHLIAGETFRYLMTCDEETLALSGLEKIKREGANMAELDNGTEMWLEYCEDPYDRTMVTHQGTLCHKLTGRPLTFADIIDHFCCKSKCRRNYSVL